MRIRARPASPVRPAGKASTVTTLHWLEEELGQSRGAIFNWLPDKWRLFLAVTKVDQRRIAEALTDPKVKLIDWIATLEAPYAQAYSEALGLVAQDPQKKREWDNRSPGLVEPVFRATEERQRRGELRDDVSARALIQFLLTLVDGLSLRRSLGYETSIKDVRLLRALAVDAISRRGR